MNAVPGQMTISTDSVDNACLVTLSGVLDGKTYLWVRDSIIKAALDEPAAVLVDVTRLAVPAPSAWSVFTSARWHVSTWPNVPISLVCPDQGVAITIARNGITRYVPVHPSVEAALRSVTDDDQPRRRVSAELPASPASLRRSRDLVAQWLTEWSQDHLIPVAKVIVDVLVHNVLRHTDSSPVVRLEGTRGTITIAVRDENSAPAVRREAADDGIDRVSGLAVVSALARAWGSTPNLNGKTVWAVIGPENEL